MLQVELCQIVDGVGVVVLVAREDHSSVFEPCFNLNHIMQSYLLRERGVLP